MSLQLVIGSAGSGKSRYLLERMIRESQDHPERPCFLLVPEQFTMETQKDVVTLHPQGGTMNLDIVSFGRLAYRIFEEQSASPVTVLDDLGKSMLLRKAVRGRKKEFQVFGRNLNKAGFFDQLKSMLSELYQYGVGEEELSGLLNQTKDRPVLNRKLSDLLVAYQAFEEELSEDTIPSEEILDILCKLVPNSKLLSGCVIALDGFTGFTPIQYRLLTLLLRYAKQVIVTVTMDPQEGLYESCSQEDLFALSRKTVRKLTELCREAGCVKEPDLILDQSVPYRFRQAPALAYAERHILRYHKAPYEEVPGEVFLYEAETPREEARFLAEEICRLVRKEGFQYRDIAVICGDVEQYRFLLGRALSDCGVPYFIDYKKHFADHPAVSLLQAALETVEKDFSYDTMFRYLKNPFSPLEPDQADELENYVLALGISGRKRWEETWERTYRNCGVPDFQELNHLRTVALEPILSLREKLRQPDATVELRSRALVEFLLDLSVEEKLEAMAGELQEEGRLEEAAECRQAYGLLMGLFDRIVGLLGPEMLSFGEYQDILETGLQEIKVGLIPPAMDRLLVGDLERTRLGQIKVLFFAGVNEGSVPKAGSRGSLFSDQDREVLEQFQVELAPTSKKNCFIQRFYLYLALTRPSHRLILSYSASDTEGKKKAPSSLIGELQALFPKMTLGRCGSRQFLTTEKASRSLLLEGIRRQRDEEAPPDLWEQLYGWYAKKRPEELELFLQHAFRTYREERLGQETAKALYGDVVSGSVSRLEAYASCAFSQFLRYGLKLTERELYTFRSADMGTVLHQSIALFFERMAKENRSWESLTDEGRKALTAECVNLVTERYGNTVLSSTARNEYQKQRVLRIADRTIWALAEQIKGGAFRPYQVEMAFGPEDSQALRVPLSQDGALYLNGLIDRVDLCEEDGRLYVRIIDYKSGKKKFEPTEVYHGLQLQLSLYLAAVTEVLKKRFPGREIVPAVMEYEPIQDPVVEGEGDESSQWLEEKLLETFRPNGVISSMPRVVELYSSEAEQKRQEDPALTAEKLLGKGFLAATPGQLQNLTEFAAEKVKDLGEELFRGQVPINPYSCKGRTACDYCPYRSVCGFDPKTPGYEHRRLNENAGELIFWKGGEQDETKLD